MTTKAKKGGEEKETYYCTAEGCHIRIKKSRVCAWMCGRHLPRERPGGAKDQDVGSSFPEEGFRSTRMGKKRGLAWNRQEEGASRERWERVSRKRAREKGGKEDATSFCKSLPTKKKKRTVCGAARFRRGKKKR